MGLVEQLRESADFTDNEKVIAAYLLEHPDEVARISSREFARRTYTSPSAVQRFCRKLGFANYADFQAGVVPRLKGASITSGVIASGRHAVTAMAKVAELEAQAMDETRALLSPDDMERIIKLIEEATYVDLYARDENSTLAEHAAYNFTHAGKVATVYHDLDRMLFLALTMPADHMAFVISRSGRDSVLVSATCLMQSRSIPVVVITADAASPLAAYGTYVIEAYYNPEFDKLGEVIFGMVLKYLFDVFFVMAYSAAMPEIQDTYERFSEVYLGNLDRSGGWYTK